ncbi:hypothetical protein AGMMS49992_18580 [Clostridia bacterium]|nr:hypothetical protein AGMMS49992_18580 [Clostridia bacterium]
MPPISIHNATELRAIGHNLSHTGDYQLANDIFIDGSWTPIAHGDGILLDGDGHRIGPLNLPLFENLNNSTIFELSLEFDIKDGADITGGLTRSAAHTSFSDINTYGTIRGAGTTGALAGKLTDSAAERCQQFAALNGCAGTGGFAGAAARTQFIDCRNLGSIRACSGAAGGISGSIFESGLCQSCANEGVILTQGARAGGISGQIISQGTNGSNGDITITSCLNQGEVTAGSDAGGIAGVAIGEGIHVESCTNLASITSQSTHAGGVCGRVDEGATILGCRACVKVAAEIAGAGGIVGGAEGPATIQDSSVDGAFVRAQRGTHRILGIAPPNRENIVLSNNRAAQRVHISPAFDNPGELVSDNNDEARTDGLDGVTFTCAEGLIPADCFECIKPESEGALSDGDWDKALKEMLEGLSR